MNRLTRFTLTAAAVFTSIATSTAAPLFTATTPGLTSVTLAAGTYEIVAVGASGGTTVKDATKTPGFGAIVQGTFTFLSSTLLDILVGGVGGSQTATDFYDSGAGGGGGTFIVGAFDRQTPLRPSSSGAASTAPPS